MNQQAQPQPQPQSQSQQQQQQQQQPPSSPLSTKPKPNTIANHDATSIIPPTDPRRTTPLHPSLAHLKTSSDATLNPLTLQPYTADDLKHHNFHALRTQYATPEAAARARDDAAEELRGRLEEAEARRREVEREMEEKEKIRETERRVWLKRRGEGVAG